jgi:hypothetical protein
MGSYQFNSFVAGLFPGALDVQRDHVVRQQPVARFRGKCLDIQRGSLGEGPGSADGVDAGQKPADPFQHLEIVQLGRATAAPGADAEGKAAEAVQGAPFQHQRGNHRDLSGGQLAGKRVFFLDLCLAPAFGPVELGDDGAVPVVGVFQMNLVDTVLIGTQRREAAVALQSHAGQRIHHDVGRERRIGMGLAGCDVVGCGRQEVHAAIVTRPRWVRRSPAAGQADRRAGSA